MKQIFTLLALVLTNYSFAQYSQNFDGTITSGCTVVNGTTQITSLADGVINGAGSLNSQPPVNSSSTRDFSTPYLAINSISLTVSFNYKLNQGISGNSTKTIQIGLEDANGFTPLHTITMDKDNDPTASTQLTTPSVGNPNGSMTFTVTPGIKRFVIKMGGGTGAGSVRIIIDDLNVSASTYYVGGCNTAPSIQNDSYTAPVLGTFFATTSVLANDNDANGETIGSIVVVTPSPDGTVSLNADGTFTFTPNPGFVGTSTTFTYSASDNGFNPASGTATVTINFPEAVTLPVTLLSFQGSLSQDQAQLNWSVADNQTGNYFEIEKSSDGKKFATVGLVSTTQAQGNASYQYKESAEASAYYRLKIVNKDGSVSYSKVLLIKAQSGGSNSTLALFQNPVQQTLAFSFTSSATSTNEIAVYNLVGAKVHSEKLMAQKGNNVVSLKLNSYLIPGTYILEVKNNTERTTTKFIKQ